MLKKRFVPVAIDQAYQRRQQDTEGDFFREIAGQSPRNDFNSTTQGFYIATASGELLLYNNNRDPAKLRRLMQEQLGNFASRDESASPSEIEVEKRDPRYNVRPPEGGLVLRVHSKVLGGYEPTENRWRSIFQSSMSRDNLWISADEHRALVGGNVPESLQRRIARYHLVDNTRGEPPMWKPSEIRNVHMELDEGQLHGAAELRTESGKRGYEPELKGVIEVDEGVVVRFDMVAVGDFWGDGPFTGGAPKGRFPLGVSFTLSDGSDIADEVPPQGSRGWVAGYMNE